MASLKKFCCASVSIGISASAVSAVLVALVSNDTPPSVVVRSSIGEWCALGLLSSLALGLLLSREDDLASGFVALLLVLRMFVLL